MAKYWMQALDYHIRLPDGAIMNLNTPQGCELVFGLYESIAELDARLKKRAARRSKKQQQPKQELENE